MIRHADEGDLHAIAHVERLSWPAGMAADEERIAARLAAFPAGQLVAERDGRLVGYASAQRISSDLLQREPLTYERLTDDGRFTRTANPEGDVFQLVGVAVLPEERGSGLARELVDRQIVEARRMPGVRRIVGVTRPVRYQRHPEMPIEEYVARRNARGGVADPVLSFHLDSGARLVSLHPNFRPEDRAARGHGVLIEYPITATTHPAEP
ncbi:MAG: GNAT family N-acetyltransferase [Planctomycetaceae bacterium]